jgi:2-octaprenyl-6-methoxyphenol hydroxylase
MQAEAGDTGSVSADVLIVGGGFVGGTLACALGDAGISSVVVEAGDPEQACDAAFDGRASAISLTSRRLLQRVGIWTEMAPDAAPMLDIRVSDGNSPLFLHYDHREIGDEPFGHMVENRFIRRAVINRLSRHDRALLLAPARIARLVRGDDGVEGVLDGGRRIRARLVVAADGRSSQVRDDAGIRVTGWSYRQAAIVCTVAHERPHQSIAHEHFLPAGPFAILPLTGNRVSIVWTERADLAPMMIALAPDEFTRELASRFGDFLGELRVIGPRWSYPLSLQYAERTVDRRLALVGDAAHAMHPIAGQGLNMGFRDVAALTAVLGDAADAGADIGSAGVLQGYERWRRFDNTVMLAATDGLNRLFSNDIAPIRLARDLGLAAVNRMPALKRLFMRHATGDIGDLPPLMRA